MRFVIAAYLALFTKMPEWRPSKHWTFRRASISWSSSATPCIASLKLFMVMISTSTVPKRFLGKVLLSFPPTWQKTSSSKTKRFTSYTAAFDSIFAIVQVWLWWEEVPPCSNDKPCFTSNWRPHNFSTILERQEGLTARTDDNIYVIYASVFRSQYAIR